MGKLVPNHVYLLDMKSWVRGYVYTCMLSDEGNIQNIIRVSHQICITGHSNAERNCVNTRQYRKTVLKVCST